MIKKTINKKWFGRVSKIETRPSKIFADRDRDGVANVFDCQPNNPRKQDRQIGARLHREAQEEFNKGNYEEANFKKQRSNWMLGHSKDDEASQAVSAEY